ncbi:MAG TPA: hypothetical protein VJQ06_01705 [Rhizomicrobium sp.]|nr:hypothetical protein [Rhizomicrobium sp.]
MGKINPTELAKVTYLNAAAVGERSLLLMPLWDGSEWHQWIDVADGQLIKIQVVDTIRSIYVAKSVGKNNDFWIFFVDFMWQRASWPEISRIILSVCDDFHLLATSASKLNHYFEARNSIEGTLINSYVQTELEYLITTARAVFDLLQEAISTIWNTAACPL